MGLRAFVPQIAACPGCGRTTSTVFQELADEIQSYVREKMPVWGAQFVGVEDMQVAVMGCIVNGPGESKHANIGISLPGTGEQPAAPVFIDGEKAMTLRGADIVGEFKAVVDKYVATHIKKIEQYSITHDLIFYKLAYVGRFWSGAQVAQLVEQ